MSLIHQPDRRDFLRLAATGTLGLVAQRYALAQRPQQQIMLGNPGAAAGACSVGTDISNGWCQIAHTVAGSSNTTSVTTPSIITTSADLLIAVISGFGTAHEDTIADLTDSKGNTWQSAVQTSGATSTQTIAYSKPSSVGSGHTFTVSNASATFPAITVIAVSGSHATPLDQTNKTQDTSGTSMQTGSITPSVNTCLIISGWTFGGVNTGTPTINSGMTLSDFFNGTLGQSMAGGLAYVTQSTAAAINPTWSWAISGTTTAGIASFKHS